MKNPKFILLLSGIFFMINKGIGEPLNLTNVIHYIPLTNYLCNDIGDYDGFLGVNMGGLDYSRDNQCGDVVFQLGLARFYIGDGKVIKLLSAKPSDLKEDLEKEYKGKLPNLTPATFGKLDGLTTVSLKSVRPNSSPSFFYFCWVQLETNIVVKITTVSCDEKTFASLTNSLQSVKINKKEILKRMKNGSLSYAINPSGSRILR